MNHFEVFRNGALCLASKTMEYSETHRKYGLSKDDWELLTQKEPWNTSQRARVRSMIAEAVTISLTIAGLPAQTLPAQYVAAVIATVVQPANLLVASTRAPEAFDAMDASGMMSKSEVRSVTIEQMQSLVMAYAGGAGISEPNGMSTKMLDTDEKK